jgi:hypothetical protein
MSRATLPDLQPDNVAIEGAAHVGNDHAAGPHLPYPRLWDVPGPAGADDSVKGRAGRISICSVGNRQHRLVAVCDPGCDERLPVVTQPVNQGESSEHDQP